MKKLLLLSILLIVGCENSTESNNVQLIGVLASHSNSHWDSENAEYIEIENTFISGWIDGDPYPELIQIQVNDQVFNKDNLTFDNYLGYSNFGGYPNGIVLTSNFDTLNIELESTLGKMNGTIVLPDTIMTLGLSETSNLPLSTSFTVSWSGSNADFYYIGLDYTWFDTNGNEKFDYLEHYTKENNFTFSDTTFNYNGIINYITVQPTNGSIPIAGNKGNMSENGGFLYYFTIPYNHNDDIIVGSGSNGRISSTSLNKSNPKDIQLLFRENIREMILCPNN